jgi:intracellular sulfur oxidation DsrE/DsrF family protein
VNSNEPAMMNLALNNAGNVVQYYKDLGQKVSIEVVAFGPGLHMLREDTSPVKARIEALALSSPEISFKACGNTRENMSKAEKQGDSANLRSEDRKVRRCARDGTAGAGLDLRQAVKRRSRACAEGIAIQMSIFGQSARAHARNVLDSALGHHHSGCGASARGCGTPASIDLRAVTDLRSRSLVLLLTGHAYGFPHRPTIPGPPAAADHRNIGRWGNACANRVAAGAAAGKRVGLVLRASTRRFLFSSPRRLDDVFQPEAFRTRPVQAA